ncbi:hypothetical protein RMSM_05363 [Rhodopirellula maiorica SM1]|uniref:Uncharacterized protein n=1 Tax=Rhodopirellula maiorica SM1 TaxID=1265738 RepID=M5RUV2_9BACT|nr:hypothetical protein RMSM_05363 [Rhodopirellula maiorica SM1]
MNCIVTSFLKILAVTYGDRVLQISHQQFTRLNFAPRGNEVVG